MQIPPKMLNLAGSLPDRFMTRIPDFMLAHNTLGRDEYLERLRFYDRFADADAFFSLPENAPSAETVESRPFASGKRTLLRFPSGFAGHQPALQAEVAASENNRHAYLHLWRHSDRCDRPLVLCVHGFAMAGPARNESMFKIARMFELGLDVALHHLPHHWRRSDVAPNNPFLRPQDVPRTLEEWVRNIHDLHASVLLLRQLGYARIGMVGASLGALTAALYATRPSAVDFMFLVVPAADLSEVLAPRASRMRFTPDAEIESATRSAVRLITPARHAARFDVNRIGVVAHQGDLICPVHHTRELVQRWGIEHYEEVVGGHWLTLDRKARGRAWYGWLQRAGFLPVPAEQRSEGAEPFARAS